MRHSADLTTYAVLALTPLIGGCCATEGRRSEMPDLAANAKALLDAYAKGDKPAVMAVMDPDIRLYGSDVAEIYSGRESALKMFDLDTRLCGGAAHFGDLRAISEFRSGDLATLFFDVPFSVASRPEMIVRFATLWRYSDGAWRLIQSANMVPTVGQSAEELLQKGP
jgi:hypothetical protein